MITAWILVGGIVCMAWILVGCIVLASIDKYGRLLAWLDEAPAVGLGTLAILAWPTWLFLHLKQQWTQKP